MKTIIILSAALFIFSMAYNNADSPNIAASKTIVISTLTEWAGNNSTTTSGSNCNAAEVCSSAQNIPMGIWVLCFGIAGLTGSRRKIISKL